MKAAFEDADHRDLRLDACRGLALWFIFIDHIPDNSLSWLTLRNYGFSDLSEIFVFISGYTCMLAYGFSVYLQQQTSGRKPDFVGYGPKGDSAGCSHYDASGRTPHNRV